MKGINVMILEAMKRTTKEQTHRLIFVGLALLIFILPLPQLFLPDDDFSIYMQATVLWIAFLYFGIILVVEVLNRRINIKKSGLAVKCVAALIFAGVCSLLVSDNKIISIYGSDIRHEGLLSLMAYYVIFFAAALLKDKKYRRVLLYCFLCMGSVISVLGIIQFTGICGFGEKYPGIAYVPMRNPNFFGGFAVMFTGVAIGGFFLYEKASKVTHPFSRWNRWGWYALVLLGYAACISAGSSLVYVGLIMMLLLYLFFEIATKRRNFLPFIFLVAGLVCSVFLFDFVRGGAVTREITSVGNQVKAEGSIFGNSVGSSRMRIWKQTVSLLPEYGLFGCGIERLGEQSLNINRMNGEIFANYFDKAHNEYLNLWVTEGIFALIFYLVFLFALFIPGIALFVKKKKGEYGNSVKEEVAMISLFAFFGYIAQAFFSISVIQVAPYFWLICGLLYCRNKEN